MEIEIKGKLSIEIMILMKKSDSVNPNKALLKKKG